MNETGFNPLRVSFQTFGCRSNFADTVDLQAACTEKGALPSEAGNSVDVFVINSCTVTDTAENDVVRAIKQARKLNNNARIVVTGCLAEVAGERLKAIDGVFDVIGPGRRTEVVKAIFGNQAVEKGVELLGRESLDDAHLSESLTGPADYLGEYQNRSRFHLRVQEGCENSCTFCIIPQTRGEYRSRKLLDIVSDIRKLASLGYQEVVLTGTHLGGWGEDLGSSLAQLLNRLSEEFKNPRIRLSSIDPNDLSEDCLAELAKSHIFCNHLHICVQAFSDKILKRMNRRYRLGEVFRLLKNIQETIPGCSIGSDLIVGFPGENREDVAQAEELFLGLPFSYLHVFPYSEREGTAAVRLKEIVEYGERKRRAARFRALSERKKNGFYRGLLGTTLEIVIEGGDENWFTGTSREFAAAKFRKQNLSKEVRKGEIIYLKAQSLDPTDGKIICA